MHFSLIAAQDMEVIEFSRAQFLVMEKEAPEIAERIMTHVMEKVRVQYATERRLDCTALHCTAPRCTAQLCDQPVTVTVQQHGPVGQPSDLSQAYAYYVYLRGRSQARTLDELAPFLTIF
eukprot:COSAG06_NODE_2184_length_7394_cov_363.476628_3_plen_120_part_00